MSRSTLHFAVAAASLATALSAQAAPVAFDFKATINYNYNYQAQQHTNQYVGQQVTGTIWLASDSLTPRYQYDYGMDHNRDWWGRTGCTTVQQGNCLATENTPTPLAILGYQLQLPVGLTQQGDLMQSELRSQASGVYRSAWNGNNSHYVSYWYQDWVQDGTWGDAQYKYEQQYLSLSANGSNLFSDIDDLGELLNLSGAYYANVNFAYYLETCRGSANWGYSCSYAPDSLNLSMTLNKLTLHNDVPEPASIGLLGLGLAALAVLRRRASK